MAEQRAYAKAGVDIASRSRFAAGLPGILAQARRPEVLGDAGPFSGLFQLGTKYRDPVLAASADGIGTKVKLQLAAGRLDQCGPDILGHSVNDILTCGAEPLFFLDYFATGKLHREVAVDVVKGLAEGCRKVGCALIGGETAEMPGMYQDNEYDLAGTIVGIVDRKKIIDGSRIVPGDAVIGLASSGLHTNGYSLARRILFETAGYSVSDTPPELSGMTLGDVLLAPHRVYAPAILPILEETGSSVIKGMAHITGGGFYDNIPRILPADCSVSVDRRNWSIPPIFTLIQQHGNVPDPEMFRTFNMGIGMTLIAERDYSLELIDRLNRAGEIASLIGEVHRGVHEVDIL